MMKILYAVQGTGNGHICRAMDIIPILQKKAAVDVLVSGTEADVELPFLVKYRFKGLSFVFGKKGGVDLVETFRKSRLRKLLKEIKSLPVDEYDLVISDFEPVASWACYLKNKPCIALSHQAAVLNKNAPRARHIDPVGKYILKAYAPGSVSYGFHFKQYSENIFTPVIRQQVREAAVGNKGHYTVYLPAYNDRRIIKILGQCKGIKWEVFSKHFKHRIGIDNIDVFPINNNEFINSMASAEGILCGAGFETPAEALYLGKKLLVIPMKSQFEQHCNAAALKEMGVPVMKSLKTKHIDVLKDWLQSDERISVDYPDCTERIIDDILQRYLNMVKVFSVQS
jgi:uncharacterized protein (TIGR00661 family)